MPTKHISKRNLISKVLILILFYLMDIMPSMGQRHIDFFGIPVYGKVDKLERFLEKEGWNIWFHFPDDGRHYAWTPLERRPDFVPASSSLKVSFSSKSKTITSLELWIRDEKRDSVYENLKARISERYGRPQPHLYSNYTFFLCKNKRGKDIGCIMLFKMDFEMDVLIYVIDFKNHWKAFKEGDGYLEDFFSNITSVLQNLVNCTFNRLKINEHIQRIGT